jgi:Tol biopolymer transport system component/DNA-binding winged helix-turn-helix (wHTH) protein
VSELNENLLEFANFGLDTEERVLYRDGAIVSLPPKVLDVLCLLGKRQGSIVTKAELMETVWPDYFVEDSNLTQSIYSLRRALGKRSDGGEFIETIPRRGYRFVAMTEVTNAPEVNGHQSQTPVTPARRTRLIVAIACGLAATVAIGFLAAFMYSGKVRPAPVGSVKFQKLTFTGDIGFAVISPDGQSIAYVKDGAINLQDIASGSSLKLNIPEHEHFGNLHFSNDGESIIFRNEDSVDAEGEIFQVPRFGGPARSIAKKVWGGVGFSPDAKKVAFARFSPAEGEWDLMVRTLETGDEEKLFTCNLPFSIFHIGSPAWSPDGGQIAIVKQTPDQAASSNLTLVDVTTHRAEQIATPRFVQIEQVAWMPDGTRLLVTGRENNRFFQLWEMDLAGGDPRPITNDLNIYRGLSLSADGKSLLARQYSIHAHIWLAGGPDLDDQRQVTFGNLSRDGNAGLGWSPDGRIVYAARITGNIDIWSVNPGDGSRKQLTENAGTNNESPFVSPDGRYVFYQSTRSGRRHIWRSDIDGSNPTQITFADNETEFWPAVSPDGEL